MLVTRSLVLSVSLCHSLYPCVEGYVTVSRSVPWSVSPSVSRQYPCLCSCLYPCVTICTLHMHGLYPCLCHDLYTCVMVCITVSRSVSLWLPASRSLSVSRSVPLCHGLYPCDPACVTVPVCVTVCIPVTVGIPVRVTVCIPVCHGLSVPLCPQLSDYRFPGITFRKQWHFFDTNHQGLFTAKRSVFLSNNNVYIERQTRTDPKRLHIP